MTFFERVRALSQIWHQPFLAVRWAIWCLALDLWGGKHDIDHWKSDRDYLF